MSIGVECDILYPMPVYERISAVVSLTLIGLALYFVLDFPRQVATVTLLNSPVSLVSPRQWLMALLLGALAMAGADTVMRAHPALDGRRLGYLATFWPLPGLVVILATQTLGFAPGTVAWAAGLAGVGVILWITLIAGFRLAEPQTAPRWAGLWQQFVGYGSALGLFVMIYYTRNQSLLSVAAVLVTGGMVALALLRRGPEATAQTWLLAAVIGIGMGQVTWALNYWRAGALQAGLVLLLILYLLVGIAHQYLDGALNRRVLWEFGGVAAVILALVLYL